MIYSFLILVAATSAVSLIWSLRILRNYDREKYIEGKKTLYIWVGLGIFGIVFPFVMMFFV